MNVLVIPSWYPSRNNPLAGIFCREQAEALGACTDCNVFVCDWGQKDAALSLAHPLESVHNFVWRLGVRREIRQHSRRFFEVFEPTVFWSPKLPGGGNKRLLAAIRRMHAVVSGQFGEIALIHAHVCHPAGYLAALLSKEIGVPFVLTEHWSGFPGKLSGGRPLPEIDLAMNSAAAVISVSKSAAKKMESFGYHRIRVIPNLVDEMRFVVKPYPAGPFRFFSMGGITSGKGFDLLLRAIAEWCPRSGEVEFVIAGEGERKSEMQALAKKLGIAGIVRWVGAIPRNDAPRCFQECHAFVLPSRGETFGVVFAEAIASGRPVIATSCGGPEDIVNEGNGLLIAPENVGQLASALAHMKEHHSRYCPDAIREDFMRRFSRPAVTAQIRLLYSEVVAKN